MAIIVDKLPDEPIIIATLVDPVELADSQRGTEFTTQVLGEIDGPVYVINDFRHAHIDFSFMVQGLVEALQKTRNKSGSIHDPRIRMVAVTDSGMFKIAVQAAQHVQYGGFDIPLFATLEDALDYVRGKIAREDGAS
jgi:hypothetical protein